ncbi:hypothetical protein [Vagococcus fluvialis]|uniref:hypothetical protein n=1 Tax=Vagococcus fluvialis TaxID=2738 RepID=UPI003D0C74D9
MSISLKEFFLRINSSEELSGSIFVEYHKCIKDNSVEDSVEQLEIIAENFIEILKKFKGNTRDEDIVALKNIAKYISLSSVESKTSGVLFSKFLYNLQNRKKAISSNDLVKSYDLFEDIIEKCQWLFSVKKPKSSKTMFPIKDLIVGLVNQFEVDDDHLIHLAIMLQLYNNISLYKNKDIEIEQNIKKLIDEYGIRCLEYLLADDGYIVIENYDEYYKNGTLIFRANDKVLIRNTSKSYFSTSHEYKIEEEKDSNEIIAYYIEKKISNSSELKTFKEIMYSSDKKLKLDVLNDIFQNENYNVFTGTPFIVNSSNNTFEGLLNDYGKNDEFIIFNYGVKDRSINNFFNCLEEQLTGFRDISIIRSGANILTLDFIIHFHKYVSNEFEFCFNLNFEDDCELYQNEIVKSFFKYINENNNYIEYCKAIEKYYSFIHTYVDIDHFDSMNPDMALIMPYEIYLPFDNPIMDITSKIPKLAKLEYRVIQYKSLPRLKFNYENENGHCIELDGYDLDEENIKKTGLFDTKDALEDIKVFLDPAKNTFFYDKYINEIIIKMNKLLDIKKRFCLNKDVIYKINNNHINELINIIYEVKLNRLNYEVFRSNFDPSDSKKCSIILYKILWHFRVFDWELNKINVFFNIILRNHYTDSATKKGLDESVPRFINIIRSEIEKDGVLVVRKENEVNQGTLDRLVSRYSHEGERESLYKTQNLDYLKQNIRYSKDIDAYTFEGHKIKKILFFVDNIMGGSSTKRMLDFYLKKGKNSNKSYVKIGHKISEIVKKNKDLEIEVLSIWSFQNGKEFIETEFEEFSLKVNTVTEISNEFYLNTTIEKKIKELYGDYISEELPKYLVIRANNMPKKTIYDENLFNTQKLIGLFNRMDEI